MPSAELSQCDPRRVSDQPVGGDYGTRNDIAVLWPPHRAPIVITVLANRGSTGQLRGHQAERDKPPDGSVLQATL